jgi:hypothetical protein
MSATKTTLGFAMLAATAGLMLVATAHTSFAQRGGPTHNGRPLCGGDCQANKLKPPTTVTNGKTVSGSGGSPNAGGRNHKPQ